MSNDAVRQSTSAILKEIAATERDLKANGIDAVDIGDWQELGEIVARIERKIMANMKDTAA